MSDLLNSLKGLKDKLNTIETTFTETVENKVVDNRKPLQERLQDKYNQLVNNQSKIVVLNAGGNYEITTSTQTINECKYINTFQSDLKQYGNSEPLFVDMSENYIVPIVEIMRKINVADPDKMMTIQIISADKDHLIEEIKQVFGNDANKIIEKCDFVYSSKTEEYRKQLEEEKKKKTLLEKKWDRSSRIQCWSCGKVNDGNFWRHKYHSTREDEYCIGGYYGTCVSCDPNGTYQA